LPGIYDKAVHFSAWLLFLQFYTVPSNTIQSSHFTETGYFPLYHCTSLALWSYLSRSTQFQYQICGLALQCVEPKISVVNEYYLITRKGFQGTIIYINIGMGDEKWIQNHL